MPLIDIKTSIRNFNPDNKENSLVKLKHLEYVIEVLLQELEALEARIEVLEP